MIFFLFIGSVLTLEFILRSEARAEKKSGAKAKQQPEGYALPQPTDFLALMHAVQRPGGNVSPALPAAPPEQAVAQTAEAQRIEA